MTTSQQPSVTIERLGSEGDGLARGPDGRLIVVPFTLPGEALLAGAVFTPSADRAVPSCRHFTACGGCVAQHMSTPLYAAWKRDLVVHALAQTKVHATIAPLLTVPARSRRRASFSVIKSTAGVRLGFHRRRDTHVLALDECHVVTAPIEAALPALARIAARLPGVTNETRIAVADLTGGLDVLVEGASTKLSAAQRTSIANEAIAAGLARLTVDGETLIERAMVSLPGPAGPLKPAPGDFFQPVAVAEDAIIAAVLAGLPKKPKRIADLFAGIGTLTLPLARHAPVFATDSAVAALDALQIAARHAKGLKAITTRYRDLAGEPLSVKELEPFDTVVLDPPRTGALAQSERLARSKVATVVMVSCHPQSLARDLRVLVDGGFKVETVTPIDQFLWSAHVEVVAVLRR